MHPEPGLTPAGQAVGEVAAPDPPAAPVVYSGVKSKSVHVESDLACVSCGYNLRTLARDAHCPECNLPVAASLAEGFGRLGLVRLRGHTGVYGLCVATVVGGVSAGLAIAGAGLRVDAFMLLRCWRLAGALAWIATGMMFAPQPGAAEAENEWLAFACGVIPMALLPGVAIGMFVAGSGGFLLLVFAAGWVWPLGLAHRAGWLAARTPYQAVTRLSRRVKFICLLNVLAATTVGMFEYLRMWTIPWVPLALVTPISLMAAMGLAMLLFRCSGALKDARDRATWMSIVGEATLPTSHP